MTAPFPNPHFAISLYCSDFRNPAPQVEYLNTVADSYHVDIMDGHFSPSMGLCTSWIEQMLPLSTLRNEVHMMVTDPDHWIDQLVAAGATMLTPHVESLGAHAFRTSSAKTDAVRAWPSTRLPRLRMWRIYWSASTLSP